MTSNGTLEGDDPGREQSRPAVRWLPPAVAPQRDPDPGECGGRDDGVNPVVPRVGFDRPLLVSWPMASTASVTGAGVMCGVLISSTAATAIPIAAPKRIRGVRGGRDRLRLSVPIGVLRVRRPDGNAEPTPND